MNLKPQHQAFADYYIELGNAEQAAIKAGYSERYARGNAYKLVAISGVKEYIDKRMEELKSERVADQQEIMEFLTAIMRGEVDEPIPLLDGEGTQRVVNVKPSAQSRKAAAELLGKRYRMWTDKTEVNGVMGVNIIDDIGSEE